MAIKEAKQKGVEGVKKSITKTPTKTVKEVQAPAKAVKRIPAKAVKKIPAKAVKKSAKKVIKSKFNKDSTLGEVLAKNSNAQTILMGFGMHCFGCPMTQMETLEEAAEVHGIELDLLLEKVNE